MKNLKQNSTIKLLTLFLFVAFSFRSCSNDDDSNNNDDDCPAGSIEIPSDFLGEYTGTLTTTDDPLNTTGSATIKETSCNTYEVNFSNDVATISDVVFTLDNDDDDVFVFITDNATTTVTLNNDSDEPRLTVAKVSGTTVVSFTGTK